MKRKYVAHGASILALLAACPALAQSATGAGVENADGDIIVTAQRRAERLQDVPITITSLSDERLRDANVQQLGDIVKLTPAIRFDYLSDFVSPTIRGVGNAVVSAGAGSNVGIYIDGFYSPNPLAADFQLLNLEGIQVLKGPQGTLFGRNTTGGAILVTSTKPSHDARGVFEASYGSFNTANFKGYVTGGLTDTIAVDLGGSFKRTDGYAKNIVPGPEHPGRARNWSVRAGVNIDLSDKVSVLFRYTHQDIDDASNEAWGIFKQDGVIYAPFQNTPLQLPSSIVPTGYREVAIKADSQPNFRYKADIFQLTANADLGFADLTSYTQYRHEHGQSYSDLDQTAADITFQLVETVDKTFTQEFLLTSKPGGNLQWTAGLFYFNYTDRFDPILVGPNRTFTPLYAKLATNARVQSYAAYLDLTYQIGDQLFITAGARYSHDLFDRGLFQFEPFPATNFNPKSGDSVTPRAVIRYQLNDQSSIYASYTRGYKAGLVDVVSGGTPDGGIVNPEHMDAFEAGYKLSSGDVSFNLSGWYYAYRGLQVSVYPPGKLAQILNAATARIYGVEGEFRYRVTPAFEVNASAAYVNAKYKDFKNAFGYVQCLNPVTCGSNYGLYDIFTVDASGNTLQRAPEFTASIGARYQANIAGGKAALSANYYYTSKVYFDPVSQFYQNGYGLLGLRAEWTDPSDRFTLAVYGDNVTGSKYRNQFIGHGPGIGSVWAPPATWGVSARVNW